VQKLTGHHDWVTSVAVTPDGRYIVSGSLDETVRVWERATGKEVQKLTGHQDGVWSVAVTPDGRYIVSGSLDQTVRVWSIDKLK
jgi:WD40 repeat protein